MKIFTSSIIGGVPYKGSLCIERPVRNKEYYKKKKGKVSSK